MEENKDNPFDKKLRETGTAAEDAQQKATDTSKMLAEERKHFEEEFIRLTASVIRPTLGEAKKSLQEDGWQTEITDTAPLAIDYSIYKHIKIAARKSNRHILVVFFGNHYTKNITVLINGKTSKDYPLEGVDKKWVQERLAEAL